MSPPMTSPTSNAPPISPDAPSPGTSKGDCVVAIDVDSGVVRQGRPMTVITVVNDNMPFLFDSILGEITESAGEPLLVTHPVIVVRHGKNGVDEILGDGGFAKGDHSHERLSVIHVHIRPSFGRAGRGIGRAAEKNAWARCAPRSPIGSRCWPASTRRSRNSATPRCRSTRTHVTEAIAFLEWLRDDNFTFLGMREFKYTGGEKSGTLERADKPGLGILSDPDVLVLRRGTEAVTTTPEIRAFLHGPEPLIVTKANAKSSVHRRIYLDYIGVKTYDNEGRACRRAAHRRPVHLDRLHALGDEDPLSALEGRDHHRQIRLQSRRSLRQGTDQRAGELSARRAVPDRRADPAQARRSHPRAGRAAARQGARCASTSSTASSRSSSSCRATATTASCARRSAPI